MHIREHVYYFLEPGDDTGRAIDVAIIVLIFLNVVALILETVESVYSAHQAAFAAFEYISIAVFSIEYILRIWSCTTNTRYAHPLSGRLRFIVSPLGIIDLLAILPFFLPFFGVDLYEYYKNLPLSELRAAPSPVHHLYTKSRLA